jgi:carbon-monoxide dehydrogenase medium subunit
MIPSTFEYYAPTSVAEAASLLAQHGESAKLLAGGHSLLPVMKFRLAQPQILISLGKIPDLNYIRESATALSIGAMTTYFDIATSDIVRNRVPLLSEAALQVADFQVRNRGTLGGSLAHADPSGDMPAVALALGVEIVTNLRTIQIEDFFLDLFTTALNPDEILTEVSVPMLSAGAGSAYAKFANQASHYAIVGVAAVIAKDSNSVCTQARIGVTGAGTKALRAIQFENALVGNVLTDESIRVAAQSATAGIEFLDDIHASAEYREGMTAVFAERAVKEAVTRAS